MSDAPQTLPLDLDSRTGWPAGLRVLLDQYPREAWPSHANLGMLARFWLDRHDGFRAIGKALDAGTVEFRNGAIAPQQFQSWFAPRLQFFLSNLHGHHQIEDQQYFPLFRAAEPRLVRGFEVLEQDHEAIHDAIAQLADAANALLRGMASDADAMRPAGDRYAGLGSAFLARLLRHLDDEEDLIIPLILDRGEQKLGVY
jgi:hemerythrin-like domain-containing protein